MISLESISKYYGDVKALDCVSLTIKKGDIFGLLGPNGAGKTTTINIITGLIRPDSGHIAIDIKGRFKDKLGVVPQELALYDNLTVLDNLKFFANIYPELNSKDRIDFVVNFSKLEDKLTKKVCTLSGGLKRRLNLAVGLINDPEVVLMDEPTVGIDPQSRNFIFENILELKKRGKTILYTTHYMEEAEKLCDYIAIIDQGRICREGTLHDLLKYSGEIVIGFEHSDNKMPDFKGLNTTILDKGILKVESSDPIQSLLKLVDACKERGIKINDIKIQKPTLENLFLKLTGKELRD